MAEVENVARGRPSLIDHLAYGSLDDIPVSQQDGWVEVALDRMPGPDPVNCLRQRDSPIHSDDLRAGMSHQAEQFPGTHAEVDPRHIEVVQ